jgi:hypothetical protein
MDFLTWWRSGRYRHRRQPTTRCSSAFARRACPWRPDIPTGGFVHLCGRARFVTVAADPKPADLVFLQEFIDARKLRTVIGRRYRLDEIAEAHRYAETGHKIGNVAVLIGDQTEDQPTGQLGGIR